MTTAHVVKGKGLADDWVVRQLMNDIEATGCVDVRLKADNENAIKLLLDRSRSFATSKAAELP